MEQVAVPMATRPGSNLVKTSAVSNTAATVVKTICATCGRLFAPQGLISTMVELRRSKGQPDNVECPTCRLKSVAPVKCGNPDCECDLSAWSAWVRTPGGDEVKVCHECFTDKCLYDEGMEHLPPDRVALLNAHPELARRKPQSKATVVCALCSCPPGVRFWLLDVANKVPVALCRDCFNAFKAAPTPEYRLLNKEFELPRVLEAFAQGKRLPRFETIVFEPAVAAVDWGPVPIEPTTDELDAAAIEEIGMKAASAAIIDGMDADDQPKPPVAVAKAKKHNGRRNGDEPKVVRLCDLPRVIAEAEEDELVV